MEQLLELVKYLLVYPLQTHNRIIPLYYIMNYIRFNGFHIILKFDRVLKSTFSPSRSFSRIATSFSKP